MQDPSRIERNVGARYQVLLIIWAAQTFALIGFFLLSLFIFEKRENGDLTMLWVLTGLSIAVVAASFVLKQKIFAEAVEKQSVARVQQAQIVAMALCEAAGLFGLTARAVTGTSYFYLPFIVAGFGMLLHFPRREQLAAASFKNRI
jgi:hypothetical protein